VEEESELRLELKRRDRRKEAANFPTRKMLHLGYQFPVETHNLGPQEPKGGKGLHSCSQLCPDLFLLVPQFPHL
jgi:hypothetical protein